jgi:biopolymer transport protein TolR
MRLMSEINVVPYIDVMLVLLVIFMITAPLLAQGVKVDLPKAPAKPLERSDVEPLVVVVDADGEFYIQFGENQDQPVDPVTLVNRVNAVMRHRPNVPVLVRGDKNVPYGDVVFVMSLLQRAGVPSVGLMTEPPEERSG